MQMKDEGVGLCVLCPMDGPGGGDGEYFLYLTEQRADGAEYRTWISCCEDGTLKLVRPYPVWTFTRVCRLPGIRWAPPSCRHVSSISYLRAVTTSG